MIFILALAMLLSFILLARLVDKFFVPSLDRISSDLKLSSDAAGATLMAVGSSAPELFVALFAVFKPGDHEAIGIGSIVGSALFNILVIVGAVALVKKTALERKNVLRDIVFYSLAVVLLIAGIWDGVFSILEAGLFIAIYIVYVFAVVNWKKWFKDENGEEKGNVIKIDDEEKGKLVKYLDRFLSWFFPSAERYYWIFLFSIVLIAALSYLLVEVAVISAAILNIPEAIIALTVIAVGTSVPDLMSSIIVAKQGRGGMGVSNAIGSNIFDILIGLGLPFMIVMLVKGEMVNASGENLMESSVVLGGSVLILIVSFFVSKWKIGRKFGFFLVALYLFYILREIVNLYYPNLLMF